MGTRFSIHDRPNYEPDENPREVEAREGFLAEHGRCQQCDKWVSLDEVAEGGHVRQCPRCHGEGGRSYPATKEMAMDAGDPALEGAPVRFGCSACGGGGVLLCGPVYHPTLEDETDTEGG